MFAVARREKEGVHSGTKRGFPEEAGEAEEFEAGRARLEMGCYWAMTIWEVLERVKV